MTKAKRSPIVPSEHLEQSVVVQWASRAAGAYPALNLLYAIPNGGLRNKKTANDLRAEGVKPGVPDLCLPVPNARYHGLYIEMKRVRYSTTSADQKLWIKNLNERGYLAVVCKGANEAIEVLKKYVGC